MKRTKSDSMPSLKITPSSGICDSMTSAAVAVTWPKAISAVAIRLGQGSRTEKYRESASHATDWGAAVAGASA